MCKIGGVELSVNIKIHFLFRASENDSRMADKFRDAATKPLELIDRLQDDDNLFD